MIKLNEKVDKKLDKLWKNRKTTVGQIACAALVGAIEGALNAIVVTGTVLSITALVYKIKGRR